MFVYILLPIYNEEDSLEVLIKGIAAVFSRIRYDYRIVAVDDGSSDSSLSILEGLQSSCKILILKHQKNLGLGNAMKTGLYNVLKILKDDDAVITMDADNTHPPEIIEKMLEGIDNGVDVVVASRYCPDSIEMGVPLYRKALSFFASFILNALFGYGGLKDFSSGYRAYSGSILNKSLKFYGDGLIEESGFSVMAEIIIKLSVLSPRIMEIPLNLLYSNKKGRSKIKILPTIKNYFIMMERLWKIKRSLKNQS